MGRKVFFNTVLVIVTLLLHVVVLFGVGVMLRAGSGAIKDGLPSDPGRYIILVCWILGKSL
jgi:hypothetical protein